MKKRKKSYYTVLKVDPDANPSEIKKAYRKAVKHCHPDVSPQGDDKFKQVQEAYETLSDPAKRMAYDQEPLSARKPRIKIREPFVEGDPLSDFFGEPHLVGSLNDAWYDFVSDFSWRAEDRPRKTFVEILLSPSEAREGGNITLDVPFETACRRCLGTGRIGRRLCGDCRGQGREQLGKKITVTIPPGLKGETEARVPIDASTHRPLELIVTIRVSQR
jgi:DnaJ-class molecular chaperone